MANQSNTQFEEEKIQNMRLKTVERDCPRCEAVLIHNNNELCYECLNCGYIDCGDDD
jgi:ribosomal protein S27AE